MPGNRSKNEVRLSRRAANLAARVISEGWSVESGLPEREGQQQLLRSVHEALARGGVHEAYSGKKLLDALQNRIYKARVLKGGGAGAPASWAPGSRDCALAATAPE